MFFGDTGNSRVMELGWGGWVLAFFLGTMVGSFLNVVIYRVPRGESIIKPGSRCPHCHRAIKPWENIPLLSFLLLRGRCAGCGKPISWRYPFVEALTGGLAVLMIYRFNGQPEALIYFVLFALLLALSAIDIATFRLPDPIVLVGALFGLGLNLLIRPQFLLPMIMGAGVGWGLMLFMYGVGWLMFRKETLGWGDIKLGGVIGLYLGPAYTAGMFAFAILLGAVIGGGILFFSRHGWGSRIPFGPYLAAGAFVSQLWGDVVWRWYVGFIYNY